MNYAIIISSISALSALLSAFVAVAMCIISRRQHRFFRKTEIEKNTPYLYPINHIWQKSEWKRFYFSLSNIDNFIPTIHYDDLLPEEKKFCNHSLDHKGETYFYFLNKKLYIILNNRSGCPSFLVEHNNATITFKNFGSLITKIHIDNIKQYFPDDKEYSYEGKQDAFYTDIILPNGELKLILDEIKDNADSYSCPIGREDVNKDTSWNMFEDDVPPVIPYHKFAIQLSIWNEYNEKFIFQITISKKGNRFYREVTKLDSPNK